MQVINNINRALADLPTAAAQPGQRGLRFAKGVWGYSNATGGLPQVEITWQLAETVRSDAGLHVVGDLGSISIQLDPNNITEMAQPHDLYDPSTGLQVLGVKWTPAQLMAMLYSAGIAAVAAAKAKG